MFDIAMHFGIGLVVSLLIFLVCTWASGVRSFSAPTAPILIGFNCGLLSHFVSPWATPVVLVLYALVSASECHNAINEPREAAAKAAAEHRQRVASAQTQEAEKEDINRDLT